jgi:hypothetical protein
MLNTHKSFIFICIFNFIVSRSLHWLEVLGNLRYVTAGAKVDWKEVVSRSAVTVSCTAAMKSGSWECVFSVKVLETSVAMAPAFPVGVSAYVSSGFLYVEDQHLVCKSAFWLFSRWIPSLSVALLGSVLR